MFKAILVVLLLAAVALASVDREHIEAFSSFKARFNKSYANKAEELARFKAFADNFDFIKRHNAEADQGLHTFWVGENEYADMTNAEFNRVMNTLNFDYNNRARQHSEGFCNTKDHSTLVGTNPTSVDWRTKGAVTPVKNQGQCGSCWSFSTTGVIEGQNFLTNGKLVSLSEQNLVDCSTNEGNMGCNGGFPEWAYEYVIGNNGIDTEASYPYQAEGPLKCRYTVANKGATTATCNDITPHQSETALENAVATVGPISVCIDASHTSFQLYSHGIYKEPQCSTTQLDHAILAVGYDSNTAGEYWIVKNSWGTTWGLQGYIWMAKDDNNMCGIATHASYSLQTSA